MSQLDPKHYDENSSFQKTVAQELLSLWPAVSTDDILDIGCGDGFISAGLAKVANKGSVLGIDPSKDMIDYAFNLYAVAEYPNLQFQVGRAESSHGINQYSLITAFNCLHWSGALNSVFENCFNALKKEGKLLAVTYPAESVYWKMFVEVLSRPRWQSYLALSPASSWLITEEHKKLAAAHKFELAYFKSEELVASYCNRQALADYIKGWLPCLLPITETEQALFLSDVLDYAENQFQQKSSIDVPYTKLTYYLVKP